MRYRKTFKIVDTEEQAQTMCDTLNYTYTPYMRKNHPAHYTSWQSADGKENKFIVWYYV